MRTLGELIDLHIADIKAVGRALGRSKTATLAMLKRAWQWTHRRSGPRAHPAVRPERAKQGAGPVALSMDIGAIKLVISHAAAMHGLPVSVEPVELARIALRRRGLVGKSNKRDRRPIKSSRRAAPTPSQRIRLSFAHKRIKAWYRTPASSRRRHVRGLRDLRQPEHRHLASSTDSL